MMVKLESFETKINMESWILRGVEDSVSTPWNIEVGVWLR
jgi:hypothetical protein